MGLRIVWGVVFVWYVYARGGALSTYAHKEMLRMLGTLVHLERKVFALLSLNIHPCALLYATAGDLPHLGSGLAMPHLHRKRRSFWGRPAPPATKKHCCREEKKKKILPPQPLFIPTVTPAATPAATPTVSPTS